MSLSWLTRNITLAGIVLLVCLAMQAQQTTNTEQNRDKQLQVCRGLDPEVYPVETCAAILAQLSPEDELGSVFVGGEFEVARPQPDGTTGEVVLFLPPDLRSRIALNGVKQTIHESVWVPEKEPNSTFAHQLLQGRELWSKLRDVFCHYHPHQGYRDLSETVQSCLVVEPLPDEKTLEEEFDGAVVLQTNWITFVNAKNAERQASDNRASQGNQSDTAPTTDCIRDSKVANCNGESRNYAAHQRRITSPHNGGQEATLQTAPVGTNGPTLAETISFMNASVQPEKSFVTSVNRCEVVVLRNQTYNFAIPHGTFVKSTDTLGVRHYGLKWLFVTEPRITRFNFASIDPPSIKSQSAPSPSFLKENDVDEIPSFLKQADLMVVWFTTTNSTQTIETGDFPKLAEGEVTREELPVFDHQSSSGLIVFESKDRAERFVTAFVHAVELCEGKGSDFAPTPSKP
jgi:hypothetical protein